MNLGIFEVKAENYNTLKIALKEIIEKIEQINKFPIEEKVFDIKWTQGGDLKWLANMNGINAANANHICCPWNCKDPLNLDTKWSISDRSKEKLNIQMSSQNKDKNGYQNVPLMNFIEYKKSIVDPLHLCLRITDKIFKKLLSHLEIIDGDVSDNLDKHPLLNRLKMFCEEDCGVSKAIYYDNNEKSWVLRSINQNERLQILTNLHEKKS